MANESEMNLGLALGSSSTSNQQQKVESSGAGAGANANSSRSRIDKKTFVRPPKPRPLTELVWSTQNGLTIKSADSNPCCLFKDVVSPSQHENKGKEKESFTDLKSIIPVGNVAGTNEGIHNQTTADLLPLLESKTENIKDDSKESGSSHEKMEETAENDVKNLIAKTAHILANVERDLVAGEASSSESVQNREKEEESYKQGNEKDEENSHGSMQSCNSANLLSKNGNNNNNKRWRFEQQLIIGSKRIKKQSQECPFSTPVIKQDSSFMNWISNMVNGIKPIGGDDDEQKMDKTLNFVTKKLGFQTVFQSLYSQDAKRLETKTQVVENNKSVGDSKEIILFNKTVSSNDTPDDILNQKAFGNLWIARFSPKTPSTSPMVTLDSATHSKTTCLFCGKRGHELRDCLQINEKEVKGFMNNVRLYQGLNKEAPCLCIKCFQLNHWASECPSKTKERWSDSNLKLNDNGNGNGNVLFKKKVSNLNEVSKNPASSSGKIFGIPKEMFDTIRRLRLSRTDILKWMNSRLPISSLDGYFIRLRLAKWEEGVGGAGYYVGCITDENPSKGSKKPICVNIGGVECLVESRYISNCDFLEDELIGWWRTMLTSRRRLPIEEELTSKLEDRKRLGF